VTTPPRKVLKSRSAKNRRRKLLLVDDHRFFVHSLKTLINGEPDMEVCDMAESSAEMFRAMKRSHPDMIVLDVMLGEESGLNVAETLRKEGFDTPVLLISALVTPSSKELQQIGRCVFFRKGDAPALLLRRARMGLAMSRTNGNTRRSKTAVAA